MIDKVIETIEKYNMINKNDFIVAGVSGGADSVCLLHILNRLSEKLGIRLLAVHVNHLIRGEDADKDEQFVKEMCGRMNVEFFRYSEDVKEEAKKLSVSVEEAGRIIRYKCFENARQKFKNGKIAVAHNKNDNAETIFMRFIRGAGTKGLCGIPYVRGDIIRPLLNCGRDEIEKYCGENNLDFRTDITNTVNVYTRNKIRLELLPWISENMNKNIISTIVNNGEIISEEEKFLDEISERAFFECAANEDFQNKVVIDIKKFSSFNNVIKRRIVRRSCRFFSKDLHDLSRLHTDMVIKLSKNATGKYLPLPSGIFAERKYEHIIISKTPGGNFFNSEKKLAFSYNLEYNKCIRIAETGDTAVISKNGYSFFFTEKPYFSLQIDEEKIKGNVAVRNRLCGDKIYIKNTGKKKLKNIFAEKKIGQKQRGLVPIVCDGENVICAAGVKASDLYKPGETTREKINIYFWRTDEL